jgi:hypothetical protein
MAEYFFVVDVLFLRFILNLDKNTHLWPTCFIWGGHLRFEASCIWVNMVFLFTGLLGANMGLIMLFVDMSKY